MKRERIGMERKTYSMIAIVAATCVIGLAMMATAFVAYRVFRRIADDFGSPIEPPVPVEARVDPTLNREGALRPTGWRAAWSPGGLKVMSEREEGGWLLFAAHHDDRAQPKVERVEIRIALDQPSVRAQVSARWYQRRSIPFFTGNESATNIHGVVAVDAARMPTAGDDRIIAYDLNARRDGKPVHFSGKIVAGADELSSMFVRQ
jgi:hypothetical protein